MKVGNIEWLMKVMSDLSIVSLDAKEDIEWRRANKLLQSAMEKYGEELKPLIAVEGIVITDEGYIDKEKSNPEAAAKLEEQNKILLNEEVPSKILSIEILNKLKCENDIKAPVYGLLLDYLLKED